MLTYRNIGQNKSICAWQTIVFKSELLVLCNFVPKILYDELLK